jgi:hypothetical protein
LFFSSQPGRRPAAHHLRRPEQAAVRLRRPLPAHHPKGAPDRTRNYTLDLTYDSNHNILAKKQSDVVTVAGGSAIAQKGTSYDWKYEYAVRTPRRTSATGASATT